MAKIQQSKTGIETGIERRLKNIEGRQFSKKRQPSPESKKAGWERKKQKDAMLNKILEMYNMDAQAFHSMLQKANQKLKDGKKVGMSVGDLAMANYVEGLLGGKFIIDWMDRHISKAPTEIGGPDDEPIRVLKIGQKPGK